MSVLIKGMEMPDKCGHCRFATAFECEVTKNFITTFNVRQADCPLAEVLEDVQPVKHGRWIDGDCRCVTAVCSNCNRLRLGNGAKSAMRLALYCEKCGARMDGET